MFGYLQPYRDELKIKEFRLYKSVYCGLCRQMGKDYGIFSRITLSYDCTFLAMLYLSLHSEEYEIQKGHCVLNPLGKCSFCCCKGKAMEFSGAVSLIMMNYKLVDTIHDGNILKKFGAKILKLLLRKNYKNAQKKYPEIDELAEKMLVEQFSVEQKDSNIDEAAEPTAKMLSELCKLISQKKSDDKVLEVFGYFLGRWIYLMDAADDLEKDRKHHNFNPFLKKYQEAPENIENYCNEVLNLTASQLIMAYDLLDIGDYKSILDNIIYEGLSAQQEYHLLDKKKKCRKEVKV